MNLAPLRIPCASFVRELPHGTPIIRTRPRLLRGLFLGFDRSHVRMAETETLRGVHRTQVAPLERVFLSLAEAEGRRRAIALLLARLPEIPHGRGTFRKKGDFHPIDLDPEAVRLVTLPHRFGIGCAVRLDGFCRACEAPGDPNGGFGPTWIHEDSGLLPFEEGRYLGSEDLCRLNPKDDRRLPDGSRYRDALALAIVLRVRLDDPAPRP